MFASPSRSGATLGFFDNFNSLWTGSPVVNYTLANGTEGTWKSNVRFNRNTWNYTSGQELFDRFCMPPTASTTSSQSSPSSSSTPRVAPVQAEGPQFFPEPIARDPYNAIAGFYLNGSNEDTAVLYVPTFATNGPDTVTGLNLPENQTAEFARVAADFLSQAKADNKSKLIIDFSGNGGGTTLAGFNLFRTLFPQTDVFSANRLRNHNFSRLLMKALDTYSEDYTDAQTYYLPRYFAWEGQVSPTQSPLGWSSYLNFTGPANDNLASETAFINFTSASTDDSPIQGYNLSTTFVNPPFPPENILLISDGYCASTCSIITELLTDLAGVNNTLVFGGRPFADGTAAPMELVGGTRGSEEYSWDTLSGAAQETLEYVEKRVNESKSALTKDEISRYKDLMPKPPSDFPLQFQGGSINLRNGYAKGSETPLHFESQPAACRLFYTRANILDPTTTWTDAARAIWGGGSCAAVAGNASNSPTPENQAGEGKENGATALHSGITAILSATLLGSVMILA